MVNLIQLFQASGKPTLSCLRHFNPTANCTRLLVMDRAQDQRHRACLNGGQGAAPRCNGLAGTLTSKVWDAVEEAFDFVFGFG